MQVKASYPTDTKAIVSIIADEAALQSMKEHVLTHFASSVKIPGFRPGKAPSTLIEKSVDSAQLQSKFLEEAVEQFYYRAIQSEKIRAVGNPQISLKKFVPFSVLEFDAEVPVIRQVILPDYTNIKLPVKKVSVSSEEVENVIKSLQKRLSERKEITRAAKDGDEVIIDFSGVDAKSKPVKGAEGKDYPLLLGSNTFIPGFETNLVGLNTGQEKTFTLTFPKEYSVRVLANKKVTFNVSINTVQELVEPKVDDSFAAKAGPFKTLAELKEDIKQQLSLEKENEAAQTYESELIAKITSESQVTVPDVLIEDQINRIEEEEKQNLAYRGQTWQEHLDEEGVDDKQHHDSKRAIAEERIKASLVLAEIADKEKLDVTPEELEIRIQLLKGQYQDKVMQQELDKPENRQDIAARILTEKTIAILVNYARK